MVLIQQYTYTLSASATTCACEVAWVSLDVVCTTHQKPFVLDKSNRCGIATVDDGLLAGNAHPTKNWASYIPGTSTITYITSIVTSISL